MTTPNGDPVSFPDGTAPGGRSVSIALAETLNALAKLEQILTRENGFMTPADQDSLRRAREILRRHR